MSGEARVELLSTQIHGRYLLDLPEGVDRPPLLVGFHGYGENAQRHLEKLRKIPGSDGWIRCAISALHPFYTKSGEVVGSWMTKQDRDLAVEDNIRWVRRVLDDVRANHPTSGTLVFAGFSQGVAMTWRAALRSGGPCHGVIALAGDVPPEFHDPTTPEGKVDGIPPLLLGRGTTDAWYTEAKMEKDLEVLARHGAEVGRGIETCVFEGGHDWTEDFYAAAGRFLQTVDS